MLLRKIVSSAFVFTLLGLSVSAQAAVVPAVGAMQGATLFAANNGSLEQGLQSTTLASTGALMIHPVLGAPARPLATVKADESNSNWYAMMGLGLIGLMLIRRKRYGRQ
ncbi:MAG: LPXTG cell wall anchor domain-containing protein [Deefgea sp.]